MSGWMLLAAAALGVLAGAIVNYCAERWSEAPRGLNPWWRPPAGGTTVTFAGKLPLLGWWWRRGEINALAPGGWVRPLVVELTTGALFVCLAWTPTQAGHFTPLVLWGDDLAARGPWPTGVWLHPVDLAFHGAQFLAQALLVTLMLTASLIDFDEKLIPDEITLPGTHVGLFLALAWPQATPVGIATTVNGRLESSLLTITFPHGWPAWLAGAPRLGALVFALACFGGWFLALWPWQFRRGRSFRRAVALTCGLARRHGGVAGLSILFVSSTILIGIGWLVDHERWQALCSALFGMVVGGGLIWVTRIVAGHVLAREALGFGDVTLMAMIGAFIGWQACVLVFFLAPLFALFAALILLVVRREGDIYYGPFLCLATLWVVVRWPAWWDWAAPLFGVPWLVPCALLACLGLLWFLLIVVRAVKEAALSWLGGEAES